MTVLGYHLARAVAVERDDDDGTMMAVGKPGVHEEP